LVPPYFHISKVELFVIKSTHPTIPSAIITSTKGVVYKNANSLKSRTVAATVRQKEGKIPYEDFCKILIGIFIFCIKTFFVLFRPNFSVKYL